MSNAKIPIEALEGLMQKVFLDSALEPGLFWDALINADLFVPLADHAPKIKFETDKTEDVESIPILLGVDSKGKNILWLFTSPAVMVDYTEKDLKYIQMPSTQAFSSIKKTKNEVVLIGPERITLNLDPLLIASLAEGKVPEAPKQEVKYIPKESQLQVGPPTLATAALEERFQRLFKDLPEVAEATFIQIADTAGSRLLLGLKLDDESKETFRQVAELVARAAEGILEKGKTLDITLIRGSLEAAFKKHGEPFYHQ